MIPDIKVVRGATSGAAVVRILSVNWRGLRCFIEATPSSSPVTADLRLQRVNGPSVANTTKPLDDEGLTSLALADDEHEDAELVVVLIDDSGQVLAHRATKVGT